MVMLKEVHQIRTPVSAVWYDMGIDQYIDNDCGRNRRKLLGIIMSRPF